MTTDGLVVAVNVTGENDRIISILTADLGTLKVTVKGANKLNGKNSAAAQLFVYAKFCLNERNGYYFLNSSEVIHNFYNIRLDLNKYALACYIAEVSRYSIMANNFDRERMSVRLVLNCLYMLDEDKRSCELTKCVFELRFAAEIGMAPYIVGCRECYDFECGEMFFIVDEGCFLCKEHFDALGMSEGIWHIKLSHAEFAAIQFICLADFTRLFNFKLSERSQKKISEASEKYLLCRLDRTFNSLDYYNGLQ